MVEVRLFEASGARWRALDSAAARVGQPIAANWRLSRLRGFAEAEFTLTGLASQIEGLSVGRRVEFWDAAQKVRLYRGYIQDIQPSGSGDTDTVTCPCVGAAMIAARQVCQQRYKFLSGVDLADAWRQSVERWAAPKMVFAPVLADSPTGFSIDELDGWDRYIGDLWEDLDNAAGAGLAIGADVAPDGSDRLYCRLLDTAPTHVVSIPDPGKRVIAWARGGDGREIVNALYLRRATAAPNLLPNGSFENPVEPSSEVSNFLKNGGFETGSTPGGGTAEWNRSGFAEVRARGYLDGSDTLSGGFCALLFDAGAWFTQTRAQSLPAGHNFRVVAYSRPENAALPATFRLRVVWDFGAGITDAPGAGVWPEATHTHNGGAWEPYALETPIPAGVHGYRVELVATAAAGGQGAIFDDVAAYDSSILYQEGWTLEPLGNAEHSNLDWATEDAKHGAYSLTVGARPGALDTSGQELRLRPLEPASNITPGRVYRLRFFVKCDAEGDKYLRAGIVWYDAAGDIVAASAGYTSEYIIPAPTGRILDWFEAAPTFAAPPGAATCVPYLAFRSTLTWQVDALSLRVESTDAFSVDFVEGDTTERIYRAGDTDLSLPPAAAGSIAAYGWLPAIDRIDTAATVTDALEYAAAALEARATPTVSAQLKVTSWPAELRPGQVVRAVGAAAAEYLPDALPIAEISGRWSAGAAYTLTLTLGRDPQREVSILRRIARDAARRGRPDRAFIA